KIFSIKEDYPVVHNNVGIVYLSQKKYEEAIRVFKKAIQLDKNYAEAHYNLSFTLSQLGRYDEALEETKKALEIEPYYTSNRFKLGVDLYADNLDLLVSKDLSKELASSEENLFLIDIEKDVEFSNIFDVETEEEKVIISEKNYLELAKESIDRGDRKEAENYLREHLRNNDKDFEALKLLGILYYNGGLWEKAVSVFQKANAVSPNNIEMLYGIAKCYRAMSRIEEAEKLVNELLSQSPENFELLLFLSELYIEESRFMDAENILNECYKKEPKELKVLINFAKLCEREGRIKEAMSYLNDAKKLSPDSPSIHFNLGKLLLNSSHYEEALDEYNKVIEMDENNTSVYRYLGICYKALSKPDLAISSFKMAVDADPLNSEVFTEMAEIYINNEEYINAREALEKALKIEKNNSKAIYLNGILAAKEGNILEAIRKWEEVITIDPKGHLVEDAKKSIYIAQNWVKILEKR
ncbi:tetratricopeptide repeat protein, partial [candidate division WOR-3 bacterium]|nr:tetratricopeptide repeat protein [candidate division WOR-3 bacterium]